ncbi:hypothetical protein [Variovorax guangxiensis]|uniref:TnsA endonuclease N-terminal domain-containing protein n=1 Tax=Variovorax guangxiensis TaxID=1775474 RepID=A0A502DV40_9BURK|nr:hypothetical protein [Variovorax guangxiensis]TPG24965.1 hypothetical protein EAH83_11075 [Variovorax ginsengisoli]TPG29217.1 hypothetical protein EAH82_10735 [Variovorax guangxiensis]
MASPRFNTRPGLKRLDRGIRKTAPTYGRPVFLTHAAKSQGGLAVESPSERLVSQMLGLDPSVRSFEPQPLTVDLLHGTLLHTVEEKARARKRDSVRGERSSFYTPDFMVRWSLGATTAVEVKTQGWDGDEPYQDKLVRAREVLSYHSIDFARLVIPSWWRHPLLTSVPLLHQAANRRDLRPDMLVMEQAALLAHSGACTLGDFCSGLGFEMRMAPVLIVFGALKVDLMAHHLRSDTPAELAYGDLDHLSIADALTQ